jgi:surfeit locus 1 family protein
VTTRKTVLAVIAIGLAIFFLGMGAWQLRRLSERQAENAFLASRRFGPILPLDSLPSDTGVAHFRRVKISGDYDYAREIVFTLRVRNGSPGVNIITPLLRNGHDTAVLVNRGWIYAPDGISVDLNPWREADTVNATGFVETFPTKGPFPRPKPARPKAFRRLNRPDLQKIFPYPIANYYVVLTDSSSSASAPPRVEPLPLDEGNYRSYAIQWFSFAAISIIGLVIFIRRT